MCMQLSGVKQRMASLGSVIQDMEALVVDWPFFESAIKLVRAELEQLQGSLDGASFQKADVSQLDVPTSFDGEAVAEGEELFEGVGIIVCSAEFQSIEKVIGSRRFPSTARAVQESVPIPGTRRSLCLSTCD